MNKTVFVMDSSGNAVQWAAGMSLEPKEVGGVVCVCVGPSTYTIHTTDPRTCVSHFVRALCACPDGSLLEWDEESGMVGCKTWSVVTKAVESKLVDGSGSPVASPDALGGVVQGGFYRHRKTKGVYRVTSCLAHMEATGETVVVYESTEYRYESSGAFCTWVRPWSEFCDGRFEYLGTEWPIAPVATAEPAPSLLPDGRPVIPVQGHPKWRELYDD